MIQLGVLQAHAAEVQRQGMKAVFQNIDRQRGLDLHPLLAGGYGILGGDDRGRSRGVGLGRLLGLLDQVVIFRTAEQHPFRLLLQQNVQIGKRHVDFPRRTFGGRGLAGQARRAGKTQGEDGKQGSQLTPLSLWERGRG